MIGIYKITSPSKRVYIGQSKNIKTRFKFYKNLKCNNQIRLYKSLIKYGVEAHKFEVICECSVDDLNYFERYYQELYNSIGRGGLNCMIVSTAKEKLIFSKDTIDKMSKAKKGIKLSPESIAKRTKSVLGSKRSKTTCQRITDSRIGEKNPMFGKPAHNRKIVLNTETGIYYDSSLEASQCVQWGHKYFSEMLTGRKRNKTSFVYAN